MVLTRVCTHPDARGRGLVYALMEAGYTECRRRGFRYVLGGCTDQLLTLYARVGLVRQPLSYTHARLNRIHEHLLFGDLEAIPTGVAERASPGATQ